MKNFITSNKTKIQTFAAVMFWIFIWHIASVIIKQEILLVSPVSVFAQLFKLSLELSFWKSILFSFSRVIFGFFAATITGTLLAAISFWINFVRILFKPLMSVVKAVPVASYTILCLAFFSSKNLSALISFLMVLPIIYTNVLQGMLSTDKKLIQMADVFEMRLKNRIKYIYVSQTLPYFISAVTVSLGLCWKAGIAAEVIGTSAGSIGLNLYLAKNYLDMRSLFAWTIVIVIISFIFEKAFLYAIKKIAGHFERK